MLWLIRVVPARKFFDYAKTVLLAPADITQLEVWPTVASPRPPHEVIHEDEGLGLSAVDINSPATSPTLDKPGQSIGHLLDTAPIA